MYWKVRSTKDWSHHPRIANIEEFTCHPRGWLVSRTPHNGDGVGQLILVTSPDGSSVTYTYDDAHGLASVADSLGNSVAYTLDLCGNRINEQVNDLTGALSRQTSRVYETLSRLQQQTGSK